MSCASRPERKRKLDLVSLLRLPGVMAGSRRNWPDSEEEQEEFGKILETQSVKLSAKWTRCERAEGRHLSEELRRGRTMRIGTLVERVRRPGAKL